MSSKDETNLTWKKSVNTKGEFVRKESSFRQWVTDDGSSDFPVEANRYHLYVSLACPWAHRTLIVRKLKGLEHVISATVVSWFLDEKGWSFTDTQPETSLDVINGCNFLRQVYVLANPDFDGRVTVPVLWDKHTKTIVNNESSEILRMLSGPFSSLSATPQQKELNLYPEPLRKDIDSVNSWIYPEINNGVYRCGFATSQEAYDSAVQTLFAGLDKAEELLAKTRFLTGSKLTEADVRLFTTLVRFDAVYHGHFKCNKKCLREYPNLWAYTRDMYQQPGIAETVNMQHITHHYMESHNNINPHRIVSVGPDLDFDAPHGRENM